MKAALETLLKLRDEGVLARFANLRTLWKSARDATMLMRGRTIRGVV